MSYYDWDPREEDPDTWINEPVYEDDEDHIRDNGCYWDVNTQRYEPIP